MRKLFFIILILLVDRTRATNYYFSTSGDDSRTSTQAQNQATPWKTINKLNSFFSSLVPGDSVLFNRGEIFSGSIIINKSGTNLLTIVLGAYGTGAKPVISGLTTVTSWTNLGSNIWESTSAVSTLSTCNMVVINGLNTPMGRTPNTGWYNIDSHSGSTTITNSSLGSPNWTGAEVVIRKNRFQIDRGVISGQSDSTITYSSTAENAQNNFGFFIQNDVRTLDAQNEWYYNPSTKKLRIYSTTSPVNVQIATVNRVVEIIQKGYITFSNIYFNGSNEETFYLGSAPGVQIQSCDLNYAGRNAIWGGNNWGSPSSNFRLENSTIANTNSNAITMANEFINPIIRSNIITNTAVIRGAGVSGTQGSRGIYSFRVDGMLVELNRLDSVGYVPIQISGANSIVQKNFITNYCLNKDDGGGIYAYDDQGTGKKILNNIVLKGIGVPDGTPDIGSYPAMGIYMDDYVSNTEIAYNTVANCNFSGLFLHNAHDLNIHHNTFYNNDSSTTAGSLAAQITFSAHDVSIHIRNVLLNNNILFSKRAVQPCALFDDRLTDVPLYGTFNNNYYARPIDDKLTFHIFENNYKIEFDTTLAGWKSYSGQDGNSKKSTETISTVNDLRFEYNETDSDKVISLGGTYIDVAGVLYPGTITLSPYTSAVLIYQSKAISGHSGLNLMTRKNFYFILAGMGTIILFIMIRKLRNK